MKHIIALFLSTIVFTASLVSCSLSPTSFNEIDTRITLTSSDATDAAAWLTDRLEFIPDRMIIGTDAVSYGVDLSALEDDGYIIRALEAGIAVFARTPKGLDRAVRSYAKSVEAGKTIEDVTYHEGYRVNHIELAGRDISEYTVFCEDDDYMRASAKEFAARIEEANGAVLSVSTEAPAAPFIALRYVHDDALNTCGYRWSVSGDGLTIECSDGYKPSSSYYAVTRFLVNEFDWFGLDNGFEDLTPAELVSIPVGKCGGETNDFDNPDLFYGETVNSWDKFENRSCSSRPMTSIHVCCHGLQANRFAGELSFSPDGNWAYDQPCYLDESFLELSIDDVRTYIENRGKAQALGEGVPFYVDIAAPDNAAWCGCKKCSKMYHSEGGTQSAAVITWANALSETLCEEYPNVIFGIFAYAGSNKPPKAVRPNEHLHITYCFDACCSSHSLDGKHCQPSGSASNQSAAYPYGVNEEMTAQLRRWCEMSENVYVWFYGLGNGFQSMPFVHTIRDDLRFFHEIGVRGMFWNNDDFGFTDGMVSMWLGASLIWDVDMSDEEYDAIYDRILRVMYGDAAEAVKAYITSIGNIYESGSCATCWWWGYAVSPSLFQTSELWKTHYDTLFDLLEGAIPLVDSELQEHRISFMLCGCIYVGSMTSYFAAYNAGDDERVTELCRRYALIDERTRAFGFDMSKYIPGLGINGSDPDLEVQAWQTYKDATPTLRPLYPDRPQREMPARVAAILAEREAGY